MTKKRILLNVEGYPQPGVIAWYPGTPNQDILNTIRTVSLPDPFTAILKLNLRHVSYYDFERTIAFSILFCYDQVVSLGIHHE